MTRYTIAERLERFSIPEPNSGCLLWTGAVSRKGYGRLIIGGRANQYDRMAHRLSWEAHNGPIPDGLCVCHKCDVPSCINPDHLWLGTRAENSDDRDRKGRNRLFTGVGEKNGYAKLRDSDIIAIRADRRSQTAIALAYGVSKSSIGRIKLRQNWAHVRET